MTSNEFRQKIGMKPSKDPAADEVRNKNLSKSKEVLESKASNQQENNNQEEEESNDT